MAGTSRSPRRSRLWWVAAPLVLLLAACSGSNAKEGDGKKDDVKSSGTATTWSEACGGIMNQDTLTQLHKDVKFRDDVPKKTVYQVTGTDADYSSAGKDLAKGLGKSSRDDVCKLQDKDGVNLLEMTYYWDSTPFSASRSTMGGSPATKVSNSVSFSGEGTHEILNVDCRFADTVDTGSSSTLHGSVRFDNGDTRSKVQLLYAATKKILPFVHCVNNVNIPAELPKRDARLK